MKNIIIAALAILGIATISLGSEARSTPAPTNQRGCCSHHGGVCGCSGSHEQCCDGWSSSCGC